jgi:hypothetical protein
VEGALPAGLWAKNFEVEEADKERVVDLDASFSRELDT